MWKAKESYSKTHSLPNIYLLPAFWRLKRPFVSSKVSTIKTFDTGQQYKAFTIVELTVRDKHKPI